MANEREILSGLRDLVEFYQGNSKDTKVTKVDPSNVDLKSIRNRLGLSQDQFADIYELPVGSIRNWEQGRRKLEGAARLMPLFVELIDVIRSNPEIADAIKQKIKERADSNRKEIKTSNGGTDS